MRFKKFALTLSLTSIVALEANASTTSIYQLSHDDEEMRVIVDTALTGMAHAFSYSNAILEIEGRDLLFCMPSTMRLDANLLRNVIDSQLDDPSKAENYEQDIHIALIALVGLRDYYPC